MSHTPLAFLSYVNLDDQHEQGRLTQFRERLSGEVRMQTGEPFDIFQDKKDIALGQPWEERINDSLDATTFLLPIITPAFFKSTACRAELERFLKREKELGRNDLILPVYYVTCPVLSDKAKLELDPLAKIIAARQYADWRELRHEPFTLPQVGKTLAKLAGQIVEALERSHSSIDMKPDPPTVVVDAWHRGDYATITQAIKAVKPGTRILVRPGLYRESIVIDKTVEILGDGNKDDIVIEAFDKDTVYFQADNGKVANLTLRQHSRTWNCVNIAQGRLELEDCDISSQRSSCVGIYSGADSCLRRNRIHDGNGLGILFFLDGKGMLEDNEIVANAKAGVMVMTDRKPILRHNRISQNGEVGIHVQLGGGGIFEDNDLRGNAKGAWEIAPDCEARVQRSGNIE